MNLLLLLYLSYLSIYASCQKIGDVLSKISYKTGLLEGGNGEDLTLNVNWNGTEFSCITNPDTEDTAYECSSLSQASATRIPSIEYFINVDWPRANTPLQITQFVLTDDTGTEYTIQEFCHPQHMQCTLDTAESITPGSMASCTQWGSKDSYDNIQLGSNTKFSALYVDIPIFGSRFANKVIEGGVRPPNLANVGLVTGGATAGLLSPISVQWDNALYTCTDIIPIATNTPYSCSSLSEPLYCPAISDFWMSIYSNKNTPDFLLIKEIWLEDETSTTYTFTENFCRDPASPQMGESGLCSDPSTYKDFTQIYIGGNLGIQYQKLVPFFVPDSVNALDVVVGEGSIITEVPEDSEFSWDSSLGGFGGPIDAECPETERPTPDPTIDPTIDPTVEPTNDPTISPINNPTDSPTNNPSDSPTNNPTDSPTISTASPSNNPTHSPSNKPSSTPSINPISSPSQSPTHAPTNNTTDNATDATTNNPITSPVNMPTGAPTLSHTSHSLYIKPIVVYYIFLFLLYIN